MAHILIFIHWFVLVFTFGNVELVTIDNSKSNDFPIEELNNYTLREVFEDNNLFYNDNPNSLTSSNVDIITYDNGVWYAKVENGSSVARVTSDNYNNGNRFIYFNANIKGSNVRLGFFVNGTTTYTVLGNYEDYINQSLIAIDTTNTLFQISMPRMSTFELWIKDIYLIDMFSLGINHLTKEQMDYWFNIYQENEQREISETYDYIENELTTNDLIYIVLFALLWGLAIKFVKGVM